MKFEINMLAVGWKRGKNINDEYKITGKFLSLLIIIGFRNVEHSNYIDFTFLIRLKNEIEKKREKKSSQRFSCDLIRQKNEKKKK